MTAENSGSKSEAGKKLHRQPPLLLLPLCGGQEAKKFDAHSVRFTRPTSKPAKSTPNVGLEPTTFR